MTMNIRFGQGTYFFNTTGKSADSVLKAYDGLDMVRPLTPTFSWNSGVASVTGQFMSPDVAKALSNKLAVPMLYIPTIQSDVQDNKTAQQFSQLNLNA